MEREVELPVTADSPNGGKAFFSEKDTGAGRKKLRAAGVSARMNLAEFPELFEPRREGESEEARAERIEAMRIKLTPEQAEFIDTLKEATVLAQLQSWTLEIPVPKSVAELEALDGDLYDFLLESTVETPETDFSPTGERLRTEQPLDEQSPTGASSSSSEASLETPPLTQTPSPSNDGSPSDGEASIPEQ